jgi:hypothetical protein
VMHDGSLEFRLEEVPVRAGSRLAGRTLEEANVGEVTGTLVLALRGCDGTFLTNPPMRTPVEAGYILIAIGTQQQLSALQDAANRPLRLGQGGFPSQRGEIILRERSSPMGGKPNDAHGRGTLLTSPRPGRTGPDDSGVTVAPSPAADDCSPPSPGKAGTARWPTTRATRWPCCSGRPSTPARRRRWRGCR